MQYKWIRECVRSSSSSTPIRRERQSDWDGESAESAWLSNKPLLCNTYGIEARYCSTATLSAKNYESLLPMIHGAEDGTRVGEDSEEHLVYSLAGVIYDHSGQVPRMGRTLHVRNPPFVEISKPEYQSGYPKPLLTCCTYLSKSLPKTGTTLHSVQTSTTMSPSSGPRKARITFKELLSKRPPYTAKVL